MFPFSIRSVIIYVMALLATMPASAATFYYWDTDGATSGAGGATPTGTWGTDAFWSPDSNGAATTAAWSANHAVFSAGNEATGVFTINVSGTQTVHDMHFDEGTVTLQALPGGSLRLAALDGRRLISALPGITAILNVPIGSEVGVTNITKYKAGTIVLGATNTYLGNTRIEGGTIKLGATNVIPDASGLIFAVATQDGINNTSAIFDTGGFSETLGTLTLQTNGLINFGDGSSALSFDDSSGIDWSGFLLTITNFTLGNDTLRFGSAANGLTATQLSLFRFADYGNAAGQIDANGFVTPVPEPAVLALATGSLIAAGVSWRRRKNSVPPQ